jgi:serine/threonine protein kinase
MGITHGDVKGDNVLIFYLGLEDRETKGMERWFMAKITDFGCAHLNDGKPARLPGCTHIWAAPEAQNLIAADFIHKTDIYSYGLLVFSVILGQDLYDAFGLEGDRFEQRRHLEILKRNGRLLQHAEYALENAKLPKGQHTDLSSVKQVLRCTLQEDPSLRRLETLEDFLKPKHGEIRKPMQGPEPFSPRIPSLAEVDDLSLVSKSAHSPDSFIDNH